MRRNQHTIDEEVRFSRDEELVSVTDTRGVIQYANPEFCRVAGFTQEELVGKNHNIVRHPDMPKAAFADMWERLKTGKSWRGAVKNRCKDGRFYWVDAFVTPVFENGKLAGYQSVRTVLSENVKNRANQLYATINASGIPSQAIWKRRNVKFGVFVGFSALLVILAFFQRVFCYCLTTLNVAFILGRLSEFAANNRTKEA